MPVLIFLFLFITVATLILVPLFWRAKERRQALDIVKLAVERDGPVPVDLMQAMQSAFKVRAEITPVQDLRRGFFLLAIGAAIMVVGFVIYAAIGPTVEPDDWENFIPFPIIVGSIGVLPSFIGVAYLILGFTARQPKA